jgi:hypothetical protein
MSLIGIRNLSEDSCQAPGYDLSAYVKFKPWKIEGILAVEAVQTWLMEPAIQMKGDNVDDFTNSHQRAQKGKRK